MAGACLSSQQTLGRGPGHPLKVVKGGAGRKVPPLRMALFGQVSTDLRAFAYGQSTVYGPVHDQLLLLATPP